MTPDQELTQAVKQLNEKLGSLDVELMNIKSGMEALRGAIENLTVAVKKK